MRPLFIDDEARAEVARVVSHAMDHPFYPGRSATPGDDPHFVALLNTYRTVFTFTHIDDRVYRHLTISVPVTGKYAHPVAAFTIASLFGFTGYDDSKPLKPGEDWLVDTNENENSIVLAQEI